ncbi:MAG TPA: DUF4097 family beta strand repeat-containing protein [Thermoanaerobaculia bacterium]
MRKILTPLLLVLLATTAGADSLTETIDRTFNVRAGSMVELSNVNGRVTVGSWDQPRVRVIARKQVKASSGDAEKILHALRVEMQPQDGGLVVNTHFPKRHSDGGTIFDWLLGNNVEANVQYDVTVPRNMNLTVRNTNGAIEVRQVDGKLKVGTTNGKIALEDCGGSLEASTTNGGIRADFRSVAPGQPFRLQTTNGRIEISLPQSIAADLDASTTNGSIRSDLPVTTTGMSRNTLRGTINGGGTPVRLRTTNGGISIRTN